MIQKPLTNENRYTLHINQIVSLEEQFGIYISEDEMIEMTSFAEIKRILRDKGVEI
jgi:uncharacterized protein YllA (UPF0747 family)